MNTGFECSFNTLARAVHKDALDKGWYDDYNYTPVELIALVGTELSEAIEALRHGNKPDDHVPSMDSVEVELGDAILRIMDMGEYLGYDIAGAMRKKHEYNLTRERKHGGKEF